MKIGGKSATRVMRLIFIISDLASAMALIGVKLAGDNSIKVGNMLRNPKSSYKSRCILK